jgi:hypothetical protein
MSRTECGRWGGQRPEFGCGAPAVIASANRSAWTGLSVRKTAARFADRTKVRVVSHTLGLPRGDAVRVSILAMSLARAASSG